MSYAINSSKTKINRAAHQASLLIVSPAHAGGFAPAHHAHAAAQHEEDDTHLARLHQTSGGQTNLHTDDVELRLAAAQARNDCSSSGAVLLCFLVPVLCITLALWAWFLRVAHVAWSVKASADSTTTTFAWEVTTTNLYATAAPALPEQNDLPPGICEHDLRGMLRLSVMLFVASFVECFLKNRCYQIVVDTLHCVRLVASGFIILISIRWALDSTPENCGETLYSTARVHFVVLPLALSVGALSCLVLTTAVVSCLEFLKVMEIENRVATTNANAVAR